MDFLRAFIGIIVVVILALLLGRLDHKQHGSMYVYGWLGAIVVLLILRFCL